MTDFKHVSYRAGFTVDQCDAPKRIIRGKRKWWTLWLTRHPDREAPSIVEIAEALMQKRTSEIQEIVFGASPLADIVRSNNSRS